MKLFEFKPKLVSCLKNYSKETFMADLIRLDCTGLPAPQVRPFQVRYTGM